MATPDRIRLTGLLPRSPAPAGLLHSPRNVPFGANASRVATSSTTRDNARAVWVSPRHFVGDEYHDVRPDRAAELAHRREDAWRRIGGEAAGLSQPPARVELEADAVSAFDDPPRRRVPVQRRPGGVGEDRHALVRSLLFCDRRRGERATERDRGEECQRAPHGAWTLGRAAAVGKGTYVRRTTSSAVPRPGVLRTLKPPSIDDARSRMFRNPCPAVARSAGKPSPSSSIATKRSPEGRCPITTSARVAFAWRGALPVPSCTMRKISICSSGASRIAGSISRSTSSLPSAVRNST